jgi:hypothetical protein
MKQIQAKYVTWMLAALLLAGCCAATPNDFAKTDRLDTSKFEYVADVVVYKEGYHFLWFIPLGCATPDIAKQIMREKVKQKYPDAAGIYEVKEVSHQSVGLFDWRPSISMWGKVVRAR